MIDYAQREKRKWLYGLKRKELIQEAIEALVIASLCLGIYLGLTTLFLGV